MYRHIRSAGRRIVAYAWCVDRVLVPLVLLSGVYGLVIDVMNGASPLRLGVDVAPLVFTAWVLVVVWRSTVPNGRAVTAAYLELAALLDEHRNGDRLLVGGDGDIAPEVFLMCTKQRRVYRSLFRGTFADVDLPQVEQPGYLSGDEFVLLPLSNLVLHVPRGALMDENAEVIETPAAGDFGLGDAMRDARFRFRTGQGFASAEQLRELVGQVGRARPL